MAGKRMSGRQRRRKGHDFEREIVRRIKERFADRWWAKEVRRSDQSHRARAPDVRGVPGVWLELETAAQPNPTKKHAQAVRDSFHLPGAIPAAVIRKKGSPYLHAHLFLDDLMKLFSQAGANEKCSVELGEVLVRIDFEAFLDLLDASETPDLERP